VIRSEGRDQPLARRRNLGEGQRRLGAFSTRRTSGGGRAYRGRGRECESSWASARPHRHPGAARARGRVAGIRARKLAPNGTFTVVAVDAHQSRVAGSRARGDRRDTAHAHRVPFWSVALALEAHCRLDGAGGTHGGACARSRAWRRPRRLARARSCRPALCQRGSGRVAPRLTAWPASSVGTNALGLGSRSSRCE
jgi:hypothetical protein